MFLEASVEIAKGAERSGRWRTGWEVNAAFKAAKASLQERSQDQGWVFLVRSRRGQAVSE